MHAAGSEDSKPERELTGHSKNVCALDRSKDSEGRDVLISGSWDQCVQVEVTVNRLMSASLILRHLHSSAQVGNSLEESGTCSSYHIALASCLGRQVRWHQQVPHCFSRQGHTATFGRWQPASDLCWAHGLREEFGVDRRWQGILERGE